MQELYIVAQVEGLFTSSTHPQLFRYLLGVGGSQPTHNLTILGKGEDALRVLAA